MIAWLSGLVKDAHQGTLILNVQGVGYLLSCPTRTTQALAPGDALDLHVETVMSAESLKLYGFATLQERDCFRLVTTVQGVGARIGLGLLSGLTPQEIAAAVAAGNAAALAKADGVGPKIAQRLVAELKNKFPAFGPIDSAAGNDAPVSDGVSGLVNLGYDKDTAQKAIAAVLAADPLLPLPKLLQAGVQYILKGRNG